jgi:hypothetical protein
MSGTAAMAHRDTFRYSKRIKRGRSILKYKTLSVPKQLRIQGSAGATGIVNFIVTDGLKMSSSFTIEYSLDGSTSWTAVTLGSYTAGNTSFTGTGIASGAKYFRVKGTNAAGTGPASNVIGPITVL